MYLKTARIDEVKLEARVDDLGHAFVGLKPGGCGITRRVQRVSWEVATLVSDIESSEEESQES